MSDGTINFPERLTHPATPATGRVKFYTFDDGSGTVEPYYKLDDGSENTLKGPQGDQGTQGIQGDPGPQGVPGPAGPMNVEGFISETGTATLPNVTNPQQVYSDSITISSAGDCFVDISIAVKPHAGNNDYEFRVQWDGSFLLPILIEEGKDQSNDQSNWRSQTLDLGSVSAGTYTLALFFNKESASGTAQIKNYTAKVVRYS